MKNTLFIIFGFLFLAVFFTACSKTNSDNVKTSGFYVTYTVTGNNQNSANCSVTLQVGGSTGTYLDLSGGDSITCNGNTMARSELFGIITYSAVVTYSPGSNYTIILNRIGEAPYSSSVILPAAVTGMNPGALTSYQKGTAISPAWTASANSLDSMIVTLSFTASHSHSSSQTDTAPENGILGFASSSSQVTPPEAGVWNGSVKYSRRRAGALAAGLSGVFNAYQEVTVPITLTD